MIVTNEPKECAVRIQCEIADFSQNDLSKITAIRIKRQAPPDADLLVIGEVVVAGQEDLLFTVRDITAQSNKRYKYFCIPVLGDQEGVGSVGEVESRFSAIFVGNLDQQYVVALNAKCEYKRKYNMTYVQTYYRRFPHAIQNGSQNFSTGSVTGLFLARDSSGEFTKEDAHSYKQRVLDFLTNGEWKLIKTGEGHIWYVQIDGELQEDHSDFIGASTITFGWTEIGPVTMDGIVIQ